MAAISAAKTTATPSASCLTTLATVFATAVPTTKNALKLKKAENHGAHRAGMARVATTVATELAASWKPLVKSNSSARAMTATMATSNESIPRPSSTSTVVAGQYHSFHGLGVL